MGAAVVVVAVAAVGAAVVVEAETDEGLEDEGESAEDEAAEDAAAEDEAAGGGGEVEAAGDEDEAAHEQIGQGLLEQGLRSKRGRFQKPEKRAQVTPGQRIVRIISGNEPPQEKNEHKSREREGPFCNANVRKLLARGEELREMHEISPNETLLEPNVALREEETYGVN